MQIAAFVVVVVVAEDWETKFLKMSAVGDIATILGEIQSMKVRFYA